MGIRSKLLLVFLGVTIGPLFVGQYFIFRAAETGLREDIKGALEAVSSMQKSRVKEVIVRYLRDSRQIITRIRALENINDSIATGLAAGSESASGLNEILVNNVGVRSLGVYDISGRFRAGVNIPPADLAVFDLESVKRGVHLADFGKDNANQVTIRVLGPLVSEGEISGLVEIVFDADELIAITDDYTGLGETGEVILAQKTKSDDALYITPLRFDAGAALERAIPRDRIDVPIIPALNRREEFLDDVRIVDYRGVPVYAYTRYIEGVDWGLAAKIDQEEALAPIRTMRNIFIGTVGGFYAVVIFLWIFVAERFFVAPIKRFEPVIEKVQRGIFSEKVTMVSDDEIGKLARTFNDMAGKLGALYASLESRVQKRTRQLKKQMLQTERQNKALAMAKARDDAILQGIGEGLVVTDEKRQILLMNGAAEKMLGLKSEQVLGKVWPDILGKQDVLDEEGKNVARSALPISLALQERRVVTTSNYCYTRVDGMKFPVTITAAPVDQQGKVIGAAIAFRDISAERAIDKAKTEFVSLASHQLRTPLSTIKWYAEMLLAGDAGKLSKEQEKYVQEVYTGNERMVALVNALLDVSRLELGTFSIDPEPTDVIFLAKTAVREMEPDIFKKKLGVTEEYQAKIPKLDFDPKLTTIIFQNLLSNAIKYTPEEGKIELRIESRKHELQIIVVDSGIGIPKNQQAQIFQKLFRADNVKVTDTNGTGLGLYIVKSIVEQVGGRIWFESEEKKGTTFFVSLPLAGMKKKEGTKRLGE